MTREELKAHCLKQIEGCEMWARHNGEEPHGKVYEEHKLILELLEQESVIDKIRAEINTMHCAVTSMKEIYVNRDKVINILDKYKGESKG